MSNPNPVRPPLPPGKGRGKGNRNKRSYIREALQAQYEAKATVKAESEGTEAEPVDGEACFWQAEVDLAMGGDAQARSSIAKRLEPELRSMQLDASLEHSDREFSDTERVERLASVFERGGEARDRLVAILGHLVGDDRSTDGGGEE